jgi:hypothetical protein
MKKQIRKHDPRSQRHDARNTGSILEMPQAFPAVASLSYTIEESRFSLVDRNIHTPAADPIVKAFGADLLSPRF